MTALRYALILALVFLPASPFATTFQVTKTHDTNSNCKPSNCSLREAIDAANTNPGADDVPVPAGTYLLTLGQLVVSDDVSIAGAGQTSTIIDGNATDRVFDIEVPSGVVEISGVTIQNGYAFFSGGGISTFSDYGDLTLTDSTVSNNATAYAGGGISNVSYYGNLTLTNSTVSGNSVYGSNTFGGGGIYSRGNLTLTNSTVSGNSVYASYVAYGGGGGIYNDGNLTLTNSTVSDNSIYGEFSVGGGIRHSNGEATLTNSTVSNNSVGGYLHFCGGGINVWGVNPSNLTLTNSTVSGNTSSSGGGICFRAMANSYLTLTNSTVSGNIATEGSGGGIRSRSLTLANTIVADNVVDNCSDSVESLGYNLTDDDSCGLTAPSDLVVSDAMLGPLADNGGPTETHALLPGSPAIDAGSVDCPPPDTDQRGVTRPQGASCDIGAVEYLPEPHRTSTMIAGAAFLGLLYRRRARGLRRASRC
jgi:CSLREA domain-containing protein